MRVGFLGLGRLGLPIAAILSQHHAVTGYDPDPTTAQRVKTGHSWEVGLGEYLNDRISLAGTVDAATFDADVIVVCVQTPHHPELDGTKDTDKRAPFDLSYVAKALGEIASSAPVVLMSTVLPGDTRRLARFVRGQMVYAPAFPAMGTTIRDLLNPEFLLMGGDQPATFTVQQLFSFIDAPVYVTDWETAELTKMLYNTFIGFKLALANTAAWLAHEAGADGGEVMRILSEANRRITSSAYLKPGLGDGGACHPRDQIALSWLADELDVFNIFDAVIDHRSAHSRWIADVVAREAGDRNVVILGSAYKADSTLTDGSPAKLLANQTGWPLVERPPAEPSCIVIGVPHSAYQVMDFTGHVVVDPWGIVDGAVQPGRRPQPGGRLARSPSGDGSGRLRPV